MSFTLDHPVPGPYYPMIFPIFPTFTRYGSHFDPLCQIAQQKNE
jgi:hypothetical protein